METVRNLGALSPKGDLFTNPLPHRVQNLGRRVGKDFKSQRLWMTSSHNRADTHFNSERL